MYTAAEILKTIERIRAEEAFFRRPREISLSLDDVESFVEAHTVTPRMFRIRSRAYEVGSILNLNNARIEFMVLAYKDGKRVTLSLIESDVRMCLNE